MLKTRSDLMYYNLAKVAKANWGLDAEAVKEIYNMVIVPKITYAAAAWHTATNKVRNKKMLFTAQRHATLRIAKAFRTISTEALLVICGVPPIDLVVHEKAQNYKVRKDLTVRVEKGESQNNDAKIYTDGSKSETGVGAALVVFVEGVKVAHRQYRLNNNCTVYQAELLAIREAVKYYIESMTDKTVLICTDSRSALDALCQYRDTNRITNDIKTMIKQYNGKGTIGFKWVRAHVGVAGNERADQLAKEATNKTEIDFTELPASYIKWEIRDSMRRRWQLSWNESDKGRHTYNVLPNIEERLNELKWIPMDFYLTQILSGHAKCMTYFKKTNKHDTEECICGTNRQTVEHLLLECARYAALRTELECSFYKDQNNTPLNLYHIVRTKVRPN
ncbi:uncharacterized protein [Centruroides vittatus]|uniref:uncharacterized protein n=1 Tax=Centruroides vittatus TaxID=120091 RepID=UPI0035100F94